jgi:hypothetical protein
MGKIASKCCKPCEANNELGNANLDQTRMIVDNNNNADSNFNKGLSFSGDEKLFNSKAKANFQEEMSIFIEKHNCNFSTSNFF